MSFAFYYTKPFLRLIFLLCAIFRFAPSLAQHPNLEFENYDVKRGLSQNQIFSIIQDRKGFIWFATDEGLNRFDGHEFKIFRHDDLSKNSLSDNSVHALEIDNDGVLWIGTNNGISRYYPETEILETLQIDDSDPSKAKGTTVNEIRKDIDGRIWIAYLGNGVDVYDPATKEFTFYRTDQHPGKKLIDDYVSCLQFLSDGTKLAGTRAGIQFIGSDNRPISSLDAARKYPWTKKIDNSIVSFQLAEEGKILYIGTEFMGFYKVNLLTSEVVNFSISNSNLKFNNNVPSLFEDSRGNVWIGGEAIYKFDPASNVLYAYNELGVLGNVVNKNPILSIYEDREHNIWFGTFRMGILKYNPENTRIYHYHSDQGAGSLTNNQVLSFNEDTDGNLWVGTDGGGLFRLKKDRNGFDLAPSSLKFSSQAIKCIYRDPLGMFWLGTWDGGMMHYDPRGKQPLEIYNPEKGNFRSRHVWDIVPDKNGDLWIGTLRDGLVHFSVKSKQYKYYQSIPGDSTSLANNDIMDLYLDSRNMLWIATSDGLSILFPGTEKFVNFEKRQLNFTVLSMYEDVEGRMWLSTNGGGIVIVNKDLRIEKTFTEKDGLPSSTICYIQPDSKGNLWASTYNGLVKISYDDQTITQVPQIAGLQGKEFISRSGFVWGNGMLAFGGVNGFNVFQPDSLRFSQVPSLVEFTSLKINNDEISPGTLSDGDRKILDKSISETSNLKLSYKDYSFTLTFSSLRFNWQHNLHYAYFLEGLDKEWQYTTAEKRYIHYTNLDPGPYTLKVKSSFDGKNWPNDAKTLSIFISPPWYATPWFRIVAILTFIMTLYLMYKTRVSFLKRQKDKLEELVLMRTHELKKSNDEIQSLLREVADKKEVIEEQLHELRQVNEEISAQRDTLENRGIELEKTETKLREINAQLEILVDKRTQKLSDALRELETFLYRASHDLRGPISSMLGLISAARLEKDPIRYNQMYTEFLQRTVMGLDRTLQKLLQKHTIEKKKIYTEIIDKTTLLLLLEDVVRVLPFYRPEDLQLIIDENLKIHSDRMLLGIVIGNLLENAFFYSNQSPNKKVMLSIRHVDGQATVITVEDHGTGIKQEIRDKIFTMFYRGHELSTGNGLGLYLVKNILDKIHGKIIVESEEQAYSRFIVSIPNGSE
jgi:ligand-binding sensor domain-containing protein/signal transduction histidine kinase